MVSVQIDSPLTAFTANSVEPALRYITPSTTSGVAWAMPGPAPGSNDHASSSLSTLVVLISSSEE